MSLVLGSGHFAQHHQFIPCFLDRLIPVSGTLPGTRMEMLCYALLQLRRESENCRPVCADDWRGST